MSENTVSGAASAATFVAPREGTGPCPKCRTRLPLLVDCAPTYFENGFVLCKQCGERVDLWQASLDQAVLLRNISDSALISLGARQNWFTVLMEGGKHYLVELTKYGIPADAKILSRRYAPQGGELGTVTAVEWYPNDSTHRFRSSPLSLLAIPLIEVAEGPQPCTGEVLVILTWVGSDDSDAWPYLATAFETAAAREYAPALVFAHSAVEISMMAVIKARFGLHVPEKKVKRFTDYGRALNIILPYLCGEAGVPQMPGAVQRALDELRDKRNTVVHHGTNAAAITPEDAMKGLSAAAFGFEYMRYVEPLLSAKKNAATKGQP